MASAAEKTKTKRVALSPPERAKLAAELGELAVLEAKAKESRRELAKPFQAAIKGHKEKLAEAVAELDEELRGHKQRMKEVLDDLARGTREVLDQAGYGDA